MTRQQPATTPTRVQYAHGGGRFHRGTHLLADYYDRETGDLIERAFEAEAAVPQPAEAVARWLDKVPPHEHHHGCGHNGEGVTPEFLRGHAAGRARAAQEVRAALANQPAAEPIEYGQCGDLRWTVEKWGRVTHKHACPNRTDPWCQTHPEGCEEHQPAAETAGLDVEPLASGIAYAIARAPVPGPMDTARDVAERLAPLVVESGYLARLATSDPEAKVQPCGIGGEGETGESSGLPPDD